MNPSTDLSESYGPARLLARIGMPELRPSFEKPMIQTIQRIMLPTDFTDATRRSYPFASNLARKFGATIYLAYLGRVSTEEYSGITQGAHQQQLRVAIAGEARRAEFNGIPIKCRLLSSASVPRALFAFEREAKCDWVVAATSAHIGLKRFAFSNVAEKIVACSTAPVLLLGPNVNANKAFTLKQALVHFDFSSQAAATLPIVQLLASIYGCAVKMVFPQPPERNHWRGNSRHGVEINADVYEQRFSRIVTEELVGLDVETEICQARVSSEILKQANDSEAGLIVVGTKNGLLSNESRTVIREARCPVLAVPGSRIV